MNTLIEIELIQHVLNIVTNNYSDDDKLEDLHNRAFNESLYVVGNYDAKKWLNNHNVEVWEVISEVITLENDYFGESQLKAEDINAEKIVNLYIYFLGFELNIDEELEAKEQIEILNDRLEILNDRL